MLYIIYMYTYIYMLHIYMLHIYIYICTGMIVGMIMVILTGRVMGIVLNHFHGYNNEIIIYIYYSCIQKRKIS